MEKSLITKINERQFLSRVTKNIAKELPASEFLDYDSGVLYLVIHTFDEWSPSRNLAIYSVVDFWLKENPELSRARYFKVGIYKLGLSGRSEMIDWYEGPTICPN